MHGEVLPKLEAPFHVQGRVTLVSVRAGGRRRAVQMWTGQRLIPLGQRALPHTLSKPAWQTSDTLARSQLRVFLQPCLVVRKGVCLRGRGCRRRPGRNVKCGWERKRSCLGRVGVASERVCICRVTRLPKSPLWLFPACRPHAAHEASACLAHLQASAHTTPSTCYPLPALPHLSACASYPLLQPFWNPCLTLGQAAPPLTGFPRSLSWTLDICFAHVPP